MNKTLNVTAYDNYLLWFACCHSPLDGLRLADLPRLEAAKKLFQGRERFDGAVAVEVPADLLPYVRAAWEALPVGKLVRVDDLPDAVARVTAQLKE